MESATDTVRKDPPPDEAWLAKQPPEPILEPELPIIDTQLAAHWRTYIELCIERFGPARCMFESNFPVEKMGIGYAALWNAFKGIAAGASAEEKLALFSGTARRAYRLD